MTTLRTRVLTPTSPTAVRWLPDAFVQHALVPAAPLSLDPDVIDAGREDWISEWTDIVLR